MLIMLFLYLTGVATGSVFGFLPTVAMIVGSLLCMKAYKMYKASKANKAMGGESNTNTSEFAA